MKARLKTLRRVKTIYLIARENTKSNNVKRQIDAELEKHELRILKAEQIVDGSHVSQAVRPI